MFIGHGGCMPPFSSARRWQWDELVVLVIVVTYILTLTLAAGSALPTVMVTLVAAVGIARGLTPARQ